MVANCGICGQAVRGESMPKCVLCGEAVAHQLPAELRTAVLTPPRQQMVTIGGNNLPVRSLAIAAAVLALLLLIVILLLVL
ncbi:MAG TPA: hypothetical protein PKE40_03685 [Arachnia sp.]|nr:hypothetical protein [Arachnia sp.]HMT85432.1 hypothetical protein [Arachnia sp.]